MTDAQDGAYYACECSTCHADFDGPLGSDECCACATVPIKSGDRINTGHGPTRRRLTLAEAEAGGLPTPWSAGEKRAAWNATHEYDLQLFRAAIREASAR